MAMAGSSAAPNHAGTKRRLKLWLLFVLLFMGWALYTVITQLSHQGQAEQNLAAAKQKINEATKQSEDLTLELKRLNDPEYIGLKATQEFGMVKKGEKQIDVVPKP